MGIVKQRFILAENLLKFELGKPTIFFTVSRNYADDRRQDSLYRNLFHYFFW